MAYMLLPDIVSRVRLCYNQVSFYFFIEILPTGITFMINEPLLDFSNQVLLQDSIWNC